ncbi:MAG TPA: polyprenyl synthetase family protein [Thermoleophilaceae bacterium]|jgi:geranylgeranyl pyrophosphate synthase
MTTPTAAAPTWLKCERTAAALERLDEGLERLASTAAPELREVVWHLLGRPGKRIRPALVLLAASWGEWVEEQLLDAAAAVEAMHVGSLCHDDVIDRAESRRAVATVNARWGDEAAEVAGTYLFARAVGSLSVLGEQPGALGSRAALDACAGEVHEAESAYDLDLDPQRHLEILTQKTATLFELPCRLGAEISGAAPEVAGSLASYGRYVGVAFQLADDALDLMGDAETLGKGTRVDVREGVYTLPVLLTLRTEGEAARDLRERLERRALTDEDVDFVVETVRSGNAIHATMNLAHDLGRRAVQALAGLDEGPARTSLANLAAGAAMRSA